MTLPLQQGFVLPPQLSLGELVRQQNEGRPSKPALLSKKGAPWSDEEHKAFLAGLKAYGRGQWKQIARYYVPSRTPTQVASHAQKHFLRQSGAQKRRSRFSAVEEAAAAAVAAGAAAAAAAPAMQAAAAPGPVPGAPALPSFFAHALPSSVAAMPHVGLPLLPTTPAARLPGSVGGGCGGVMPQPGAVVGGIALGVPIGVLPPLPSITTATGTELPILPVMPGRINALAASTATAAGTGATTAAMAAPAAAACSSYSGESSGSELFGQASRPASPGVAAPATGLPPLPELSLPLHSHSRGMSAAAAAGTQPQQRMLRSAATQYAPTGRTRQLLRLLELNEQQQLATGGGGDGVSSGSAPSSAQHPPSCSQQHSTLRRVPSATAALDTLASLAEAEAQSCEAAATAAVAAAGAAAAEAAAQRPAQRLPPAHDGHAALVSAF